MDLPIHEPEIDVIVRDTPISIKTMTGKQISSVKLIWTVDREKAIEFSQSYEPGCDMFFAHVNWDGEGGLYYFTKDLQTSVLVEKGRAEYVKVPKPGTTPRGVEISTQAIRISAEHPQGMKITVKWEKKEIQFDPHKHWLDLWEQV